jgi:hypothetical protein
MWHVGPPGAPTPTCQPKALFICIIIGRKPVLQLANPVYTSKNCTLYTCSTSFKIYATGLQSEAINHTVYRFKVTAFVDS